MPSVTAPFLAHPPILPLPDRRDLSIVPGRNLLFLDELQDCPNARSAFKFLAEDGQCDVVATGSLLGIKYKYRKRRERMEPRSIPVGFAAK